MLIVTTQTHQPPHPLKGRVEVGYSNFIWTDVDIEELQYGMIKSAINDVRDGRKSKLMQREAKKWLMDDDYDHPLSFCNCCLSLGLDEERLRLMLNRLLNGGFHNESI